MGTCRSAAGQATAASLAGNSPQPQAARPVSACAAETVESPTAEPPVLQLQAGEKLREQHASQQQAAASTPVSAQLSAVPAAAAHDTAHSVPAKGRPVPACAAETVESAIAEPPTLQLPAGGEQPAQHISQQQAVASTPVSAQPSPVPAAAGQDTAHSLPAEGRQPQAAVPVPACAAETVESPSAAPVQLQAGQDKAEHNASQHHAAQASSRRESGQQAAVSLQPQGAQPQLCSNLQHPQQLQPVPHPQQLQPAQPDRAAAADMQRAASGSLQARPRHQEEPAREAKRPRLSLQRAQHPAQSPPAAACKTALPTLVSFCYCIYFLASQAAGGAGARRKAPKAEPAAGAASG